MNNTSNINRSSAWLLILSVLATVGIFRAEAYAPMGNVIDSVLYIPRDVTEITESQYQDREDFTRVEFAFPAPCQKIAPFAFMGCRNLREIRLPNGVLSIGEGAFRECVSLESVNIPARITMIPRQCFAWCAALPAVELPFGINDIASQAFAYCTNLESINIPLGVKHIGANAFSLCSSLKEIALPKACRELESYAFSECTSLRTAVLPANSAMLGELIFSGCNALESITICSATPPTFDCNSQLFDDNQAEMYLKCRLIVPDNVRYLYRKAPIWSLFFQKKKTSKEVAP